MTSTSRDARLSDLIGTSKQNSDLKSHSVRVRYTESTSVSAGNYFRVTLPKKSDDAMLDCRSVKMRFNLNITSTDATCILAGSDARCIFNRIRILSGSTVLLDVAEVSQLCVLESVLEVSSKDSSYSRYLRGQQPAANRMAYTNGREYIIDATPRGTLLNSESLLPLSRMSDIHLEFWLESGKRCLYSPGGDTDATFSISNVELLTEYITSPSISQFFNSNPLRFSVVDMSHRYNPVLNQEFLLRLSSSHVSLNGILTVIRDQARTTDITAQEKFEMFDSGANRDRYNVLVYSLQFFEQDEASVEQSWKHLTDLFPCVEHATFFNGAFATERNVLALNLMAAPSEFQKVLTSGVPTGNMNSDITYRIRRHTAPATPLRADSFLFSDAVVYLEGTGRDLKVRF